MTREEHLKNCKICLNKEFTFEQGLICNLTGRIADFEIQCQDFKVDEEEVNRNKPSLYQKYIDEHYKIDREFELVGDENLKKFKTLEDIPAQVIIKNGILKPITNILALSLFLIWLQFIIQEKIENETSIYLIVIFPSILILKNIYDLITSKHDFFILREGLKGEKRPLIKWVEIEFMLIARYPKSIYYLVIGLKNGKTVEFDITSKNVSRKKISHFCFMYQKHSRKSL